MISFHRAEQAAKETFTICCTTAAVSSGPGGVDTSARFDARDKQVNGTFGACTSTVDARRIVLGAKVYF